MPALAAIVLALVLLALPAAANARAGDLDRSFGTRGRVVLEPGSSAEIALPRPGGGFVTIGDRLDVRGFTTEGRLTGTVIADDLLGEEAATALQPDGRLLQAAGGDGASTAAAGATFGVRRLLPDGRLDPAFGTGGTERHRMPGGGATTISDIVVAPSGRLLLAGTNRETPFVVRLRRDGSVDRAFGRRGYARFTGSEGHHAAVIAIRRDGGILLAGSEAAGGQPTFDVAAFRPSGRLDRRFGRAGRARIQTGFEVAAIDRMVPLSNGRVLLLGSGVLEDGHILLLARLRRDGALDRGYGPGATSITRRGFVALPARSGGDAAVDRGGRLVVAASFAPGEAPPRVFRVLPDGRLDRRFGRAGVVDPAVGDGYAAGLRIAGGRILLAGTLEPTPEVPEPRLFLAALQGS